MARPAAPALSRLHGPRRVAEKLVRRFKKLTGKPDNSPWILSPNGRGSSGAAYVDFLFGLDYVSPNAPLVKMFRDAMAPYGLSLLPVNKHNVERVTRDVQRGWLQPHLFLDLCSTTDPRFESLMTALIEQGTYVVDDPRDLTRWTYKAPAHADLERAGLPVPPSVVIPKGSPDRDLTSDELAKIGDRCVIKPSVGFANRGVVVGVAPTRDVIANARDFDRNDDWLVQRMLTWQRYGDRPAYLRAYNVLGHRTLLWWSRENGQDRYDLLTWDDFKKYDLIGAIEIVDKIADVTGIDFFSSEIAITADAGHPNRFALIDYVNDQCDMDPEVRPGTTPVPEPWVRWVCQRVAEFAFRQKHGMPRPEQKTLTLF